MIAIIRVATAEIAVMGIVIEIEVAPIRVMIMHTNTHANAHDNTNITNVANAP